jgi:hypothetical protein
MGKIRHVIGIVEPQEPKPKAKSKAVIRVRWGSAGPQNPKIAAKQPGRMVI